MTPKQIREKAKEIANELLAEVMPKEELYGINFIAGNGDIKIQIVNGIYLPKIPEERYPWTGHGMNFMLGFQLGEPKLPNRINDEGDSCEFYAYSYLMRQKGWKLNFARTFASQITRYTNIPHSYRDEDYSSFYIALTAGRYIHKKLNGKVPKNYYNKAPIKTPQQLGKAENFKGFYKDIEGYSRTAVRAAFRNSGVRVNTITSIGKKKYRVSLTSPTGGRSYHFPILNWSKIESELEKFDKKSY